MSKVPKPFANLATPGSVIVRSPGRINLIGEHTDYNQGFVLPAAIDKAVYVSAEKSGDNKITLYSVDFNESIEVRMDEIKAVPGYWPTYIFGVVDQLQKKGYPVEGFNMNIYGDIPVGAGLSSSAAIECAAAFALDQLFDFKIERKQMALLCQAAEHEFAGVKCGIMDQFASLFGKKDQVIKLDCRTLEFEYIPFDPSGYEIVLFNSMIKHSLASTKYNVRRSECEQVVKMLQYKYPAIKSLRDVDIYMLDELLEPGETIYRRCRYVIEENTRLIEGCEDLRRGDLESFGKKMFATHEGLRKDYEVSCPELDFLVDQVKSRSEVIGARMMGGGFGGCTINIIKQEMVEEITKLISNKYREETGKEMAIYKVEIENGTSLINK